MYTFLVSSINKNEPSHCIRKKKRKTCSVYSVFSYLLASQFSFFCKSFLYRTLDSLMLETTLAPMCMIFFLLCSFQIHFKVIQQVFSFNLICKLVVIKKIIYDFCILWATFLSLLFNNINISACTMQKSKCFHIKKRNATTLPKRPRPMSNRQSY